MRGSSDPLPPKAAKEHAPAVRPAPLWHAKERRLHSPELRENPPGAVHDRETPAHRPDRSEVYSTGSRRLPAVLTLWEPEGLAVGKANDPMMVRFDAGVAWSAHVQHPEDLPELGLRHGRAQAANWTG